MRFHVPLIMLLLTGLLALQGCGAKPDASPKSASHQLEAGGGNLGTPEFRPDSAGSATAPPPQSEPDPAVPLPEIPALPQYTSTDPSAGAPEPALPPQDKYPPPIPPEFRVEKAPESGDFSDGPRMSSVPRVRAPATAAPPVAAPAPARPSARQDNGFTRETVFFATDRAKILTARKATETYTTKRGALEYGYCEVSVPDTHDEGELEKPGWYEWKEDPKKHIVLLDPLRTLDRRKFIDEMKARIGNGSEREVLVFVHGYNVSFADAMRRTAQLAHDLKFPGAAVCFSWPSGNGGNYATDWTNAEWATPHCVEFLELVAAQLNATRVHLIAHSMGSRVLTAALKEITVKWGSLSDRPLFYQVVLAAPDLDAEVFRTQIAPAIRRSGERLTIYTSTKDKALSLSESLNGYRRLGSGKELPTILESLPWLECVDATALLDDSWMGLRHSYYGDSPQLIHDLQKLLRGNSAPARGLAHLPDGSYVVR